MPSVHLIEGPVGAGKSTFARKLASDLPAVHIPLDEWFVRLFSPDRPPSDFVPGYLQRKGRLVELIWNHALQLVAAQATPILELGLIQRQARLEFYERASSAGVSLRIHLLDAPLNVRWERVQQRNENRGETFSMVVPKPIFDMASSMWEAPDEDEIQEHEINVVLDPR